MLDAAFSDEVILDGNNSDVIEIGIQAMVLRLAQFNDRHFRWKKSQQRFWLFCEQKKSERQLRAGGAAAHFEGKWRRYRQPLRENELEWIDAEGLMKRIYRQP